MRTTVCLQAASMGSVGRRGRMDVILPCYPAGVNQGNGLIRGKSTNFHRGESAQQFVAAIWIRVAPDGATLYTENAAFQHL